MDLKHEKCFALNGFIKPFGALFSCFIKGGVLQKTRDFVFFARLVKSLGHRYKIMPPSAIKSFLGLQKNDRIDALADIDQ